LAVRAARKKIPALVEALDGTFTDHHAFMCRHLLDQIDHLDRLIAVLDERIKTLTKDHDQDLNNLDTIPGIGRHAAEIILAETGGDMTTFATRLPPGLLDRRQSGLNESAGVAKAWPTRGGNGNLKRVLGIAAMAAVKKKDSYYWAYYRRLAARRGRQRALVAVMRKLAIAIWHILHYKVEHHDLGADYFAKRDPQRAIKRMIREANALGMTVRFDPIPAA
jgi:transposase